jgi:hypothetical protein
MFCFIFSQIISKHLVLGGYLQRRMVALNAMRFVWIKLPQKCTLIRCLVQSEDSVANHLFECAAGRAEVHGGVGSCSTHVACQR